MGHSMLLLPRNALAKPLSHPQLPSRPFYFYTISNATAVLLSLPTTYTHTRTRTQRDTHTHRHKQITRESIESIQSIHVCAYMSLYISLSLPIHISVGAYASIWSYCPKRQPMKCPPIDWDCSHTQRHPYTLTPIHTGETNTHSMGN